MALPKAFFLLGLFLCVSLFVFSHVAAANYAVKADEAKETVHVEDAKFGRERGGGGYGRCYNGCCGCCRTAQESMTFGDAKYGGDGNNNGGGGYYNGGGGYKNRGGRFNNGGGGGGNRGCQYGCCRCC